MGNKKEIVGVDGGLQDADECTCGKCKSVWWVLSDRKDFPMYCPYCANNFETTTYQGPSNEPNMN